MASVVEASLEAQDNIAPVASNSMPIVIRASMLKPTQTGQKVVIQSYLNQPSSFKLTITHVTARIPLPISKNIELKLWHSCMEGYLTKTRTPIPKTIGI